MCLCVCVCGVVKYSFPQLLLPSAGYLAHTRIMIKAVCVCGVNVLPSFLPQAYIFVPHVIVLSQKVGGSHSGGHNSFRVRNGFEDLWCAAVCSLELEDGRHVAAAVAVVGRTPYGYQLLVEHVLITCKEIVSNQPRAD